MKRLQRLWMFGAALAMLTSPVGAATIHVPSEQPTIQAGIDAASYGDTVLVACGTYYEHDIQMKSGICVRSESGPADCVTIDAEQQGRVFSCENVDGHARIVGLVVTGGLGGALGGGMWCDSSAPTVTSCCFTGNEADYGGGACLRNDSDATFTDCTFADNTGGGGGGAVEFTGSSPAFTNCGFAGNRTILGNGGAIRAAGSSPTLMGCIFTGNHAAFESSGAVSLYDCSAVITGCAFVGNTADSYAGAVGCWGSAQILSDCAFVANLSVWSGALHCDGSSTALESCTFAHNTAGESAGEVHCSGSSAPTLSACIIAFSDAGQGAVYCEDERSTPVLTCCDIYGNAGGDWVGCIADQFGVDGNFSEDPLFCFEDNPDQPYSLHEGSPCLPGNSPCGELVGGLGLGCGPVSPVEATSWGVIKAMYR